MSNIIFNSLQAISFIYVCLLTIPIRIDRTNTRCIHKKLLHYIRKRKKTGDSVHNKAQTIKDYSGRQSALPGEKIVLSFNKIVNSFKEKETFYFNVIF